MIHTHIYVYITIFLFTSVQAPQFGIDAMKQRLHNNNNNTLKEAVLLYNRNDVNFIAKVIP